MDLTKSLSEKVEFINNEKIHFQYKFNNDSKVLICFLPSAQANNGKIYSPVYHRASWHREFDQFNVIIFSDPALEHSLIPGCWFLSKEHDYIRYISATAEKYAKINDCNSIIYYGSSMGGFGALMCAAESNSAHAIAEIPQMDLRDYKIRSAIASIEKEILDGESLSDFHRKHPERVSVIDRFAKCKNKPPYLILTNNADPEFDEHINFLKETSMLSTGVLYQSQILVYPDPIGHKPLDKEYVSSIISNYAKTVDMQRSVDSEQIVPEMFEAHFDKESNTVSIIVKDSRIVSNIVFCAIYTTSLDGGEFKSEYISGTRIKLPHNLESGTVITPFIKYLNQRFSIKKITV